MRALPAAIACALALLAACGDDDDQSEPPAAAAEPVAELVVTVHPEGRDGPERRTRIECTELGAAAEEPACRRLAGITPARLAPVPAATACTQIYGGPAVATVEGTLRGERIDARFDRTNGCEIERWDRNAGLLGEVKGRSGPETP